MPGRLFRLSVHRKNEERKKYACKSLPVSIGLSKEFMVFKLSISLVLLKYVISLPISVYLSTPVVSPQTLRTRLKTRALPPSWVIVPPSSPTVGSLVLGKFRHNSSRSTADVFFMVTINCHFGWHVVLCGNHLDRSKNEFLSSLPPTICTFYDLVQLLESLDSCRICMGNCEEKFLDVVKHRNSTPKGIFVVFLDAVLLFMFVYLLCVQTKIVLFLRHSWHRL